MYITYVYALGSLYGSTNVTLLVFRFFSFRAMAAATVAITKSINSARVSRLAPMQTPRVPPTLATT